MKEIEYRRSQLQEPVKTIYFGGGTPSMLSDEELKRIMDQLYRNYNIDPEIEFTLECNPDDLTPEKVAGLKRLGVNRLSIGVQSFFEEDLRFFNRAHTMQQAERSIQLSQDAGITNITIDLIYNTPQLSLAKWEKNLDKVEQFQVPHLSAYTLTFENNTALSHLVNTRQVRMPGDELAVAQFNMLVERTKAIGMIQYEVSNFGKEGYFSQHNSNYWKGVEYLGFGPSAHSYTGQKRSWNVAHNLKYIEAIRSGNRFCEEEMIDEQTAYNEYVLTRLRTIWGIDRAYLAGHFSADINRHFEAELAKYLKTSYLQSENNRIRLTSEGLVLADSIASDLFIVS